MYDHVLTVLNVKKTLISSFGTYYLKTLESGAEWILIRKLKTFRSPLFFNGDLF